MNKLWTTTLSIALLTACNVDGPRGAPVTSETDGYVTPHADMGGGGNPPPDCSQPLPGEPNGPCVPGTVDCILGECMVLDGYVGTCIAYYDVCQWRCYEVDWSYRQPELVHQCRTSCDGDLDCGDNPNYTCQGTTTTGHFCSWNSID